MCCCLVPTLCPTGREACPKPTRGWHIPAVPPFTVELAFLACWWGFNEALYAQGAKELALKRKDTTADGGNDEAGGWDFGFVSLAPV